MLPALIGIGTKALLPSSKKVDKNKLLNRKGSAIERVKDQPKENNAPIVKRSSVSSNKLLKTKPSDSPGKLAASASKGGALIKKPKDTVDNILVTLVRIQDLLKSENKADKKKEEMKIKIRKKEKAQKTEETLEKKRGFSFTMPQIKVPNVPFIDKIMTFFGNILIGSLVLFIYKKIEEIIKFFQETFLKIQEFFKLIEPFVKPVWEGMKWVVGEGSKLIAKLLGIPSQEADTNGIKKNLEEITKKIPIIGDIFKGIKNTIDSIRGYKEDAGGSSEGGGGGGGGYSGPETPLGKGEVASANRIYSGLVQRGFTKEESAAITGNIRAESSFNTGAVNRTSGAFGLMQWAYGRKARLMQFAQQKGKPATDLNVQLDYIVWELKGGNAYETSQFKKAMAYGPDVASKTKGFAYEVERASNAEIQGSLAKRIGAAKSVYGSSVSPAQQKQQVADVSAQRASVQAQTPSLAPTRTSTTPTPTPTSTSTSTPTSNAQVASTQTQQTMATAQVSPVQPMSSAAESFPQITQQADYEIPSQSSMVVPFPIGGASNAPGGSVGRGGMIPIGISRREALNSYYQSQLVGFLYKQG